MDYKLEDIIEYPFPEKHDGYVAICSYHDTTVLSSIVVLNAGNIIEAEKTALAYFTANPDWYWIKQISMLPKGEGRWYKGAPEFVKPYPKPNRHTF